MKIFSVFLAHGILTYAILRYGEPISMADYEEQFLSTVPGEARLAVKRLTRRIEENLVRFTINADDWSVYPFLSKPLSD